jgi:hypothetical protein
MNQDGAVTVQSRTPELLSFGGIFPSNLTSNQVTVRLDSRLNETNSFFLRYSHDGNDGLIPNSGTGSLPSNWSLNSNWADQSIGSLTTALRPNLTNELRFSYWYWHTRNLPPTRGQCPGECIGLGMPTVSRRVHRSWNAADRHSRY